VSMNILTSAIRREPSFAPLIDSLMKEKRPVLAGGLCESASGLLCGAVINELKERLGDNKTLIILPDENKARELCERLSGFSLKAYFFPARDYRLISADVSGREFSNERLGVLSRMLKNDFDVIVTTVEAACQQTIPRAKLRDSILRISRDEPISLDTILSKLEELGYNAKAGELTRIACLRRTNSFCNVFVIHTDWDEDAFVLQKEEVGAVKWCEPARLARMVSDNMLYNYGDAYFRMLFHYQKTHR